MPREWDQSFEQVWSRRPVFATAAVVVPFLVQTIIIPVEPVRYFPGLVIVGLLAAGISIGVAQGSEPASYRLGAAELGRFRPYARVAYYAAVACAAISAQAALFYYYRTLRHLTVGGKTGSEEAMGVTVLYFTAFGLVYVAGGLFSLAAMGRKRLCIKLNQVYLLGIGALLLNVVG